MRYKWENKYLYWGITSFCVIAGAIAFFWILTRWDIIAAGVKTILRILTPFIWGLVIAYLLTPVLKVLEERILMKAGTRIFPEKERYAYAFSRSVGILVSISLFLVLVVNLISLIASELYSNSGKIENLINSAPNTYEKVLNWAEDMLQDNPGLEGIITEILDNIYNYFLTWVEESLLPNINQFFNRITTGVIWVINGVLNLLIGIVVSVYVMYNKEKLGGQFKKLLYSIFKENQVMAILESLNYTHRAFGGFFSGKILDSLIIGIICFFGMTILKLPSPVLISIIIGITNIIPFFGPFIGAIPSALLIVLESPMKCLIFILFVICLQQFDGNILGPKILGNSTGLPGLWILFAILVGQGLFGVLGMICGVPVFAVIYGAIRRLCYNSLEKKDMPTETEAYMNESLAAKENTKEPG